MCTDNFNASYDTEAAERVSKHYKHGTMQQEDVKKTGRRDRLPGTFCRKASAVIKYA